VTRIGVLGGTFDPIHIGHLAAASQVHHELALDVVLLVPANAQPLKPAPTASGSHRLAMCRAVAAADPRLSVSDVDLVRGGPTYTVDTLADLRKGHAGAEFFFITGADSLATLEQWRDYERLVTLATFVGVTRPGHSLGPSDAPHVLVDAPALAVSSTDIRDRVRAGAPIRYLVPDAVAQYVQDHELYLGGLND
jgi:nicotinate-nucleotide adenylyltransferase